MNLREAKTAITRLHVQLGGIVAADQEQEVGWIAVPVLDAVISAAREHLLLDDPVLAILPDLISPETIEAGGSIRAVDAYLVASPLEVALDRAIAAAHPDG